MGYQTALDLRSFETTKFHENCKIGWRQNLAFSLPSRYKTFVITGKTYGETDIKFFLSIQFLPDFFTVNQ